ncbi:MAG: hypothetical protein PVH03_09775 [Chloroflexota bacterium]|jgi:hypothetical protein
MTIVALRIFIFTFLPLLLAAGVILFDASVSSRERRLEVLLIFIFSIGVAGSGIGGFFGHFFLSDIVAESVGWPTGSPFQLEMGFANLAIGVLGVIAASRRDGFREATVIAVTVLGVGATIVHLMDIVETGNLAPGNTLQNVGNLVKPALLIVILATDRREEASPHSEANTPKFDHWRMPLVQSSGFVIAIVATAFGLGFALGQPWLITLLGILLGIGVMARILIRSPWHELSWSKSAGRTV